MPDKDGNLHWLMRPTSVRKLWFAFAAVLLAVVAAQAFIYIKGYFGVDRWFGFGAVYGFASCLLMVLVAKLLGVVLKRPQDYYAIADEGRKSRPVQREAQRTEQGQGQKDSAEEGQQGDA